jgi:plastocyanin
MEKSGREMADNHHMPSLQPLRTARRASAVVTALGLGLSCGGSSTPTEPENPVLTNTITITATGVSPKDVQIAAGTRVLFVNNDSRSHNMASDAHPEHTDCPEINQVGLLGVGQSRETGNLNLVRTCRFHDHDSPNTASLSGAIVIR